MNTIQFHEQIAFNNYFDNESLYLCRADTLPNDVIVRKQLVSICNQKLVYESLFREALNGTTYKNSDDQGFLDWAQTGWKTHSHFVFFMINRDHHIVGALDIKSANLVNVEIGYWASAEFPENITNVLQCMLQAAIETGFSKFMAYVRIDNEQSTRVLKRAGFMIAEATIARQGFLYLERGA